MADTLIPDALTPDTLRKMHAYWRAAKYFSVGQIYLRDNSLLDAQRWHHHGHAQRRSRPRCAGVYLLREKKFDVAGLEALVDHRSGLLGISGVSSDMRQLHEAAVANPDAKLAIDMFCASVRKQIASMIAVLDGVDMLVFTGGIGENDAQVRADICKGLSWIGVTLDASRNAAPGDVAGVIHDDASRCRVQVLASQEDEQIARHTWALLT